MIVHKKYNIKDVQQAYEIIALDLLGIVDSPTISNNVNNVLLEYGVDIDDLYDILHSAKEQIELEYRDELKTWN